MIEISVYRQRIGCFGCGHHSYYGFVRRNGYSVRHAGVFAFCLTFIVLAGLTDGRFANDPTVEPNPGPFTNFSSPLERSTFLKLKEFYNDISQIGCHRIFLCACDELDIIPRGFDKQKLSLAPWQPNDPLIAVQKNTDVTSAREKMRLHIRHYEQAISRLTENKNELSHTLHDACPSSERYEQLIAELDSSMINGLDSRMLHHNKKLNRFLDTQLKPTPWIQD